MVDPLSKNGLPEFTRAEFLDFVERISHTEGRTEQEDDEWVEHFIRLVAPHPQSSDLLFWPEEGADDSPEGIVAEIERFRRERGLPGFTSTDG